MFFINPNKKACGVNSLGLDAYEAIKELGFKYTENLESLPKGSIYIFNWHPGTNLSVLNTSYLKELGGKSIGFLHDPYNNPDFFDIKCRLDPNFIDSHPFYGLPRIIKEYSFPESTTDKIIVGTWGYGLAHKGYLDIINKVESELTNAVIRLHIPFSDWCDPDGVNAIAIANRCKEAIKNNQLEITHEYLAEDMFVRWANENTINLFSCNANIVAGISSCVDTALMAKKPIGVNKCMMFSHIYNEHTSLEHNTIIELINNNSYLQRFRDIWTEHSFREKIKWLIEKIAH